MARHEPVPASPALEAELAQLAEAGFVILRDVLSPGELRDLHLAGAGLVSELRQYDLEH